MTGLNIILGVIFGWLIIGIVSGFVTYIMTKNDTIAGYAFETAIILYGILLVISGVLFWF